MASFCFAHPVLVRETTSLGQGVSTRMRTTDRVQMSVQDPPAVDFGVVATGATRTLRIEAPPCGGGPIAITRIVADGPFRVQSRDGSGTPTPLPFQIRESGSPAWALELDITFEPTDVGRTCHGLLSVELIQDGLAISGCVRLMGALVGLEPDMALAMASDARFGPEAL